MEFKISWLDDFGKNFIQKLIRKFEKGGKICDSPFKKYNNLKDYRGIVFSDNFKIKQS